MERICMFAGNNYQDKKTVIRKPRNKATSYCS